MVALILLGCLPSPPRVEGRTFAVSNFAVDFPPGWQLTTTALASGVPQAVAEARQGPLQVAVSFHPLPFPLPALDLFTWEDADTPVERLPGCRGAVLRQRGERWEVGFDDPAGVVRVSAWGDSRESLLAWLCPSVHG